MTDYILVRHGVTKENKLGIFQGSLDVPLDDLGLTQVRYAAQRLRDEPFAAIYTSPLQRALATANEIRVFHPCAEYIVDRRLTEINCGLLEGHKGEENMSRFPNVIKCLRQTPGHFAPPGGETAAEAYHRVAKALLEMAVKHTDQRICLVTHGFMLQSIFCLAKNQPPEMTPHLIVGNASISHIRYDNGFFSVVFYNDDSHLPDEMRFTVANNFFMGK